jgi:hypothetical protein
MWLALHTAARSVISSAQHQQHIANCNQSQNSRPRMLSHQALFSQSEATASCAKNMAAAHLSRVSVCQQVLLHHLKAAGKEPRAAPLLHARTAALVASSFNHSNADVLAILKTAAAKPAAHLL